MQDVLNSLPVSSEETQMILFTKVWVVLWWKNISILKTSAEAVL